MHHPSVELRGGAAQKAIANGDAEPKSAKARRRQMGNKSKIPKPRPVRSSTKMEVKSRDDWHHVTYTLHLVTDEGKVSGISGKTSFENPKCARVYFDLLVNHDIHNPIEGLHDFSYYSAVTLFPGKTF
jgi:hypothetical protein